MLQLKMNVVRCCRGDWTGDVQIHKKRKGAGEPGDSEPMLY